MLWALPFHIVPILRNKRSVRSLIATIYTNQGLIAGTFQSMGHGLTDLEEDIWSHSSSVWDSAERWWVCRMQYACYSSTYLFFSMDYCTDREVVAALEEVAALVVTATEEVAVLVVAASEEVVALVVAATEEVAVLVVASSEEVTALVVAATEEVVVLVVASSEEVAALVVAATEEVVVLVVAASEELTALVVVALAVVASVVPVGPRLRIGGGSGFRTPGSLRLCAHGWVPWLTFGGPFLASINRLESTTPSTCTVCE